MIYFGRTAKLKIGRKKIVDERQERQSLKNGSIVCAVMMIMLCVSHVIQTLFLNRGFSYYGPEFITLMTGCVLRLILDIRQGNVYTEMNSKIKRTAVLYVSAALIFSVVVGIRNYMLFQFELWKIVYVIISLFIVMMILFLAVHFAYLNTSKKRLEKLERQLEEDEE